MPLTDNKIRNIKTKEKPFKLSDMDGLFLLVNPSVSKIWRYKFRLNGKENIFTIDQYPSISFKEAREYLQLARKLVSEGINPTHQKKNRYAQ